MKLLSPTPGTIVAILLLDIILVVALILTSSFLECRVGDCPAPAVQYFIIIVAILITVYLIVSILAFIQEVRMHRPYDPKPVE